MKPTDGCPAGHMMRLAKQDLFAPVWGSRWDDGFVNQKLLGFVVATVATGTILGGHALVRLLSS